jgi:enoyl-CoA hydratase/carnithine racemase
MILELTDIFLAARDDPLVKFIILTSHHPKAFCAGGDIKQLIGKVSDGALFFKAEFQLLQLIARFQKPVISLLNGILMGGGVGISINTTYRIGNQENYTFAMPETSIGLYPDVGGSYFLSQVCSFDDGVYIGLTGERLKCPDSLYCGFLTHSVKNLTEMRNLEEKLTILKFGGSDLKDELDRYFLEFKPKSLGSESHLAKLRPLIQKVFTKNTVEEIMVSLKEESPSLYSLLSTKCPTSMKLTLHLLQTCKHKSLEDVLQMDYEYAVKMIQRPDFKEGVRAVLVDRDNKPIWNPCTLNDVVLEKEVDLTYTSKLEFY